MLWKYLIFRHDTRAHFHFCLADWTGISVAHKQNKIHTKKNVFIKIVKNINSFEMWQRQNNFQVIYFTHTHLHTIHYTAYNICSFAAHRFFFRKMTWIYAQAFFNNVKWQNELNTNFFSHFRSYRVFACAHVPMSVYTTKSVVYSLMFCLFGGHFSVKYIYMIKLFSLANDFLLPQATKNTNYI